MKISVLGDSISAYEGYNPIGYGVFYTYDKLVDYDLTNVNDTWWMQVINALNGELLVNNSFAGTFVYESCEYSISAVERCQSLHTSENEPDIILVYAGTNDCFGGISLEDFYFHYDKMLKRIKDRYKNAKIFCSTLTAGSFIEGDMDEKTYNSLIGYSEVIRKVTNVNDVCLIDLLKYKKMYSANDSKHPNKKGHYLIATTWLNELKKYLKF